MFLKKLETRHTEGHSVLQQVFLSDGHSMARQLVESQQAGPERGTTHCWLPRLPPSVFMERGC
jgi:hypothetical protein